MRFLVLVRNASNRYEAASERVYASFEDAEAFRASLQGIAAGPALTVGVVRPDDAEDVWFNQQGAEFLFLYEYESAGERCVWLFDENGIEVGVRKDSFLKHFTRKSP